MNLLQVLNNGYDILKSNNIDTYKIDTELILSQSLNISREKLILNLNRKIKSNDYKKFQNKIERRKAKEPVAYIRKKNFGKMSFISVKMF